jgi:hypothetical protein
MWLARFVSVHSRFTLEIVMLARPGPTRRPARPRLRHGGLARLGRELALALGGLGRGHGPGPGGLFTNGPWRRAGEVWPGPVSWGPSWPWRAWPCRPWPWWAWAWWSWPRPRGEGAREAQARAELARDPLAAEAQARAELTWAKATSTTLGRGGLPPEWHQASGAAAERRGRLFYRILEL